MSDPWERRAARLAALIPRDRLHPAVLAWADARPAGEAWALALSGGPDSVCLLLLLLAHWPARRGRLRALHFNHRLRGAASAADARFCAGVCAALCVSHAEGSWTGPRASRSEGAAREARFAFFDARMRSGRCKVLWLGHQQDDIAETLLMRLTRGSGTAGLAAPRPVQEAPGGCVRLRPLLSLKKAEIVAALRSAGVPWREDASNRRGDYFRNRVRNGVLARLVRASGRDALAGAALTRELLEEDDRALEKWTDSLHCITPAGGLNLGRLSGVPRAVARRALHRWLLAQPLAGDLSRKGFDGLLLAVERGNPTRQSLGPHGFAVIRSGWLRFAPTRNNT